MATARTEVESQIIELSTKAFQAFCNEISETFDIEIKCQQQEISNVTIADLKKLFKKQTAVNIIDSKGSMSGTFQLIFDQDGLFTLGGIVTNLSEEEILAKRKKASAKEAASMVDAVGEAGNLLATSFDDIFREGLDGHDQLSPRLPAFIGKPWGKPEENIGLARNDELEFIPYEITAGSLPAFKCGIIFPKTIFTAAPDSAPEEEPASSDSVPEEENAVEPETNEKAEQENPETENPAEQADEEVSEDTPSDKDSQEATEEDTADSSEQAQAVEEDSATEENVAEVEEKSEVSEKNNESQSGTISETIQKMTQSLDDSPGEPSHTETAKNIKISNISEFSKIYAEDIMHNQIIWISPEDGVQRALATMQQNNVSYLMVGKNGVLEGIVSRFDITGAMSPYLRPIFAKWRRPSDDATLQIKIKWIMRKPVDTVGMQTSLEEVIENMSRLCVRALPVVDEQNKVKGLITVFEIFSIFINKDKTVPAMKNSSQESLSE